MKKFDLAFSLCIAAALAFVAVVLGSCASIVRPRLRQGAPVYLARVSDQSCRASLPLTIRGEIDLGVEALRSAGVWEIALGFRVFIPAPENEQAAVTVTYEACPLEYLFDDGSCRRLAQIVQECEGGSYVQRVEVFEYATPEHLHLILVHELGHALGVERGGDRYGHAPECGSVMHPYIPVPRGRNPRQKVLPADVASVRAAWLLH